MSVNQDIFKKKHEASYFYLDKAMKLEEANQLSQARENYVRGLAEIASARTIRFQQNEVTPDLVQTLNKMVQNEALYSEHVKQLDARILQMYTLQQQQQAQQQQFNQHQQVNLQQQQQQLYSYNYKQQQQHQVPPQQQLQQQQRPTPPQQQLPPRPQQQPSHPPVPAKSSHPQVAKQPQQQKQQYLQPSPPLQPQNAQAAAAPTSPITSVVNGITSFFTNILDDTNKNGTAPQQPVNPAKPPIPAANMVYVSTTKVAPQQKARKNSNGSSKKPKKPSNDGTIDLTRDDDDDDEQVVKNLGKDKAHDSSEDDDDDNVFAKYQKQANSVPMTTPAPMPFQANVAGKAKQPISQIPEFKGIDKKLLDHILDEVVDSKPDVSWDDIAGLKDAKQTLTETVIFPSLRPDLFNGLRAPARGILLFGPPGNGKTLLAKAVAGQCKATFFSISASSLVSKWHGEGEKLVKALFAAARYLQPSVIFIDEVDAILSARSTNEHEASRRLKTEMLVQMDGVQGAKSEDRVLVLAATNIPWDLDEAVMRRFTRRILIPMPDAEARTALITNLMKNQSVKLSKKELATVVSMCNGYSGSDLKALCQEAALMPIRELDQGSILKVDAKAVRPINVKDFMLSVERVKPSTSMETLKLLSDWNKKFGSFQQK